MFKIISKIVFIIYLIAQVGLVAGQDSLHVAEVNELLRPIRVKYQLPALAGAIVTGENLVAIGAVGVRKAGTDVPVTIEDLWHLGSDTKAMTATLIGALVEQNKLSWNSTIEELFPVLADSLQKELRQVTLLHLLSHRSGLPANIFWNLIPKNETLLNQRRAVVKIAAKRKLSSEPGSSYLYSNLGYVIAGAMAENVMGKSWEELITQLIFKPLKMNSAGFGGTGTSGKIDQPWGHSADGKPVSGNGPAMDNPPVLGPAGTVHCTLRDWARFVADQIRGERGEAALLKTETYKRLHSPPFGGNYASGWLVTSREWAGGTVFTHAGSNTMNYAVVWMAPIRNFAVLVCTNQGGTQAAKGCDEAAGKLIRFYENEQN